MIKKIPHTLSAFITIGFLVCLPAEDAVSQNARTAVQITTTDGLHTAIDTFGVSVHGSYCLDDCVYTGYCEEELPILYPVIFEARFVESRPGPGCLGVGVRVNLQQGDPYKPDTFWLRVTQPDADGYPISLSWKFLEYAYGMIDADVKFTSMWMSDTGEGLFIPVNMLADSSATISDRRITLLQIITTTELWVDVYERNTVPSGFSLFRNYPNPFNPGTTISYRLATPEYVTLSVYDNLGRRVSVLEQGRQSPGVRNVHFDATGLPGGIYIARLVTRSNSRSLKLVHLK